jgi:DNA polymerase I
MELKTTEKRTSRAKTSQKILLVDGNSFLYRAYYAIPSLSNSKGEPTNAIYGFIAIMRKLMADSEPDYIAVCFDRKEPTFRHDRFKDYKVHRKPMPEDLVPQIEPIKEFCRLYKLAVFEKAGFEADDLIGTLAVKAADDGYQVYIVTGDKDALQLVNDNIKVLNPHKEHFVYDIEKVKLRFEGLGPEKVVEVMALMGDSSDNIPGVKGIGEKGALKLIHQFGTIENLIKNADKISSKSQQNLIKDQIEMLRMSRELAKIDTQVDIKMEWEKMKVQAPDEAPLMEFYKRYEFRGLQKDLTPATTAKDEKRCYKNICTEKEFQDFVAQLKKIEAFSFDTETTSEDPTRAQLVGLSFAWEPLCAYYIPVTFSPLCETSLPVEKVIAALKPILENPEQKKYGQHIKYDWIVMKRMGVNIQGVAFDTMIASYLANPLKLNHNLDDISLECLGVKKITTASLLGTGKNQITMADVPIEKILEYACEDADCVYRLVCVLEKKLEEHKLLNLFHEVELPLSEVLAKMEMNGVYLDLKFLKELSENAGQDLEKLTSQIYKEAGTEFNINSTKQLAEILFERLKLPVIKKTKTGYSTDVSVLEKLALTYELPKKILEYREKQKLKSTYLDALPEMINPETGLIHTSYHQTVTATGRLSSSDPNLQNIPIKNESGRMIRKAFIPRPSKKKRKMLSADYSQIELRILAHLSGDASLTKAFKEDRDVHKYTATLLYGVKEPEVTYEMRNLAKTINFSIIYGKTAFGLAQDLGISVSEADGFIENYFKRYSAVKEYLESQKEQAKRDGYLTTMLGRRSYFPDIHSKNPQVRQFAERAAINAPIQGSAADLIKVAMIAIQRELENQKFESLMIMQVHDELVFDMPENETERLSSMVRDQMQNAYKMRVPLQVDIFVGDSWYKK